MSLKTLPRVSLIGAGRVGSAITLGLRHKGYRISSIISRTGKPARALAHKVGCKKVSTEVGDIDPSSDFILVAVPDEAIEQVATALVSTKRLKFKSLFIAHTSGAYSSDVFLSLRRKGALVASIHPIQSFPRERKSVKVKDIYFGIEGPSDALKKAESIVRDLEAHVVVIQKEFKPLYHVACVFASSYMISILNAVAELAKKLQLKASWTEVFGPLMTSATENSIRLTAAHALTGPILRSDTSTLSLHLKVLGEQAPQFLPLYCVAGIDVARTAAESGTLSSQEYQNIVTLFRTFVKSYPETKKKRT